MSTSAVASAVECLALSPSVAVRLHAARTLPGVRRLGSIRTLCDEAERDMFARDVRDLFLLPYAEALRTGRLRGQASGILGPVLSSNASAALDALLARGCTDAGPVLRYLLDDMLERSHPAGFLYEPYHRQELAEIDGRSASRFLLVTANYVRYFIAFGRGRDPRVRSALEWIAGMQHDDGAWRDGPTVDVRGETGSYLLTRSVAAAVAELPMRAVRRYAGARRRLAAAWANRILPECRDPDAVLEWLDISSDPRGPLHGGPMPELPGSLRDRLLYFPLEDLWLALRIGAPADHPNLAPWIEWLRDTQLADGSWRLGNPGLRERLLLSDPNGRLRAEALYVTDEWITLRAAQILQWASRGTPAQVEAQVAY
ncbi:MAG: hypothetical protein ACT4PE_06500 [Candidatus Eiseniibacteriota bacterium]